MTTPQDAPIHTVEDVDLFIAQQNYEAKSSDEICLNKGDVVVILDTVESTAPKKAKLDPELDQVVESSTGLLDTSAARHKIAVKPKKKHRTSKQLNVNINARWKVRVLTSLDEAGAPKEGWVPMLILRPADEPGTADGPPPPDTQYRRDAVIRELIDTEEEFCKDLQDVLQRYYFPLAMDARMGNKRPPKCVRDNHELIFGNLKQITDFHNTVLLEGIKYYASEPVMLGRVFLRLERDFDKHVNYCRDEPLAQHFLQNNMDAKDYFAEVSQRLGDDKTLSEHLKLPIQRINDYQLLLKELVKYTCWLQEDASYLQRALELMLTVPHRASDDKFTSNIEGYRGSIHKLGRLLAHDWYSITKAPFETAPSVKKERYLFLFKARILVCKVKRISEDRSIFLLKDIIKLPDVEVRDFPNDPRTFELHQANTPGYPLTLTAHRDLVKLYWLDEIRQYSSDIVALEEHIADDLQIDKTEEVPDKLDTQVTNGLTTSEILVSPASGSYKTAEDHTVSEALETTLKETELSEAKTIIVEAKRAIVIPVEEPLTAEIQKTVKKSIEEEESFETSSVKKLKVSHETETINKTEILISEKQTLNKTNEEKSILRTEENKEQIQQKQKEEIKSLKKQEIANNKIENSNQLLQSTVETTEELKVVVKEEKSKEEEKKETVKVDICSKNQAKTEKETETVIQDHTKEEKQSEVAKVGNLKKDQLKEENPQLIEVKKEKKEAEPVREAKEQIEVEKKSEIVEIQKNPLKDQENLETVKLQISKQTNEEKKPKTVEINISEKEQLEADNKLEAIKNEVPTTNKDEKEQEIVKDEIPKENTEEKKSERVEADKLKKDQVQEQRKPEIIKNQVSKQTQEEKKSENIVVDTSKKKPQAAKKEKKPESEELNISKKDLELKEQDKSEITLIDSTKQYQDQKKQNLEAVVDVCEKDQLKEDKKLEISEVAAHKEHKTEERKKSEEIKIKKEIGINIKKDISKEEKKPEEAKVEDNNKKTAPVETSKQIQEETKEDTDMSHHRSSFTSSRTEYREEIASSYSSTTTGTQSVSEIHQNVAVSSVSEVDGRIISSESSTIAIEDGGISSRSRGDAINGSSVEIQEILTESTGKPAFSKTIESCTVELAHEKPHEPEGPSAPVFLVRLKDTELTEGTYLRFMVKIKGEPKPKVTFYKDNKDITEIHKRIKIVRNHEETGFYEMVIDKVKQEDAGVYRCVAENKLGKDTTEAKVKVSDQKKNIFGELEKEKKPLEPGEIPQFMWQRNGVYFEPDERFKVLLDEQEDSLALVFSHVRPEDAGLYTCVAQTSNGMLSCSAELTVQGTVLPKEPTKPKIIIEQRKYEVSAGSSAMLDLQITGFPRPLVTWSYNGQPIEASSKYKFLYEDTENYSLVIKNVTSEDSGKYQVKAKNDLGTDSSELELSVKAPPRFKTKMEDNSCIVGETLKIQMEIEGTPQPTLKLYKDGQELTQSDRISIEHDDTLYMLIIYDAKMTDTGSYSAVASNSLSQVSEFWKTKIYSPPKILKKLENVTGREYDTVSFEVKVESDPAPTVTWYKNDQEITSEASNITRVADPKTGTYSLKISNTVFADAGNYKCILKNDHGTSEETARLDIRCAPTIRDKIQNITVTEGDVNVELKANVEGFPKPSGKWFLGDVEITESRNEFKTAVDDDGNYKLIIKEANHDLTGKYTLKLSNDLGTTENSAQLTVNCKPKLKKKLEDTSVDEGATLKLQIEVIACPDPEVKWYKDGSEVSADARIKITRDTKRKESYNLTVDLVKYEDGGEYEVIVTNVLGSISCKSTVTVYTTPQILDSNLEDGTIYESQIKKYFVKAFGTPIPEAEWLYNGEPMKGTKTVKITQEERTYNLEISDVRIPKNEGKYECKLKNHMGEVSKSCNLKVINEGELRKPKVKQGLINLKIPKNETTTMSAVIIGDPCPDVTWYQKNLLTNVTKEIEESEVIVFSKDCKEIEDSLKECTYTLTISKSLHEHSGEYTLKAKNKYGECETCARLDILLKPEIYDVFDVSIVPGEQVELSCTIHANPEPVVAWIKDDVEIKNSSSHHIEKIRETEQYKLKMDKVSLADDGKYIIKASNEIGESIATLHLNTQTQMPAFITKLTDQTIDHKETATLHIRCDGLPKPSVKWFRDGKPIETSDRIKIDTKVEAQVTSDLTIQDFDDSDSGKYTCIAQNVIGDVETSCRVVMAQTSPDFGRKLDKSLEVFEGEPLELKTTITGSPKPSVKWYKDGELIKEGDKRIKTCVLPEGVIKLSIEKATPDDSGAYKVILTNPNGQAASLCAVIVNPEPLAPKIVKNLKNVSVPAGQPLKLEAKIEGYPSPKLEWFKDDIPIRPSQGYTMTKQPNGLVQLEVDLSKPENAGVYTLTASNKLGEVTDKATVEIQRESTKPEFKGELLPVKVVEGFPAKLQVKVSGHPKPQVSWSRNGAEVIPDDKHIKIVEMPDGTSALLIDKCTPHDSGTYQVKISNPNGETSTKAQLTVIPKKDPNAPEERPTFVHGLRDVVTDEGIPLKIEAPIRGNPVPNVSWTKDGKPIEPSPRILETCDGTRIELNIDAAEPSDAGVYGCKLVNPLGEDASECKATVRKIYQPPNFIQKFTDLQQLPTYDAKFPCRISGVPYPEITWYKDNKPIRESEKYHIKRDGDSTCLYVRNCIPDDNGRYKCTAVNREGTASCEAGLQVVDKIETRQKIEPPSFLKKIGDTELYKGMTGKFTACATGFPEPEVEWQKDGIKLFPSERIRMEKDRSGLLRLTIERVDTPDTGKYTCRIFNEHGQAECHATLTFDSIDIRPKRPVGEQYTGFDKYKSAGVPVPLADPPIISKMTDRHLTLSWKPSVPTAPRFPVTYQVEMLELPHGDWKTVRTGIRSCVCGVPNLEPFHDYKFRIRVENSFGISDPSPFAVTHRCKLEPEPPTLTPYLPPGAHFSLESSQYFPKDFDIERPLHGNMCQPPIFLRQDDNRQYGVKNHNADLIWFVYGYPKPKISYTFNDEPIEMGGRYDCSYTRNGQATLFVNKMLDRDVGMYEAIAKNEHGEARQRVRLEIAEPPRFYKRLEEQHVMLRKSIRLEAKITGVPYPEIKWYKDWQPLASSARVKIQFIDPDTCILVINDLIARDEGLYSISARNVAGTISSSAMIYIADNEIDYNYYNYVPHISSIKPKTKPYEDFYDLGDELGRGTQGVIYHTVERLTGRNYAAKIMHGGSNFKPFMYNELEIMNTLNHRKLIRLQDAFERDSFFMLVTELAAGGELVKDNLLKQTYYTESEIAAYIRQLLYGIEHMHDKSIAHCGLTIGDLLISHPGSDDLKICDFGLARRIQMGRLAPLHYGVPEYVSPETAKGEPVTLSTDMWSIGIITYILLSGISPFRGKNDRETLNKIRSGNWVFTDDRWVNISSEAKDFIRKLLVTGPELRLDVKSALKHPWLTRADKIITTEYQISTDHLRNYYNLFREWYDNASCKRWYRRNKLSVADEHPSCMVYPPGECYTPDTRTPERIPRKAGSWETHIPDRPNLDYEIGVIKSESHYQNGPDTYLLQLRDTDFPVRLRKYMKVAASVRPGYTLSDSDYDWRTPSIHERRRFTDVMDEEIDDERKARISKYGSPDTYTLRRLRHELGYRLDSYAEAEALIESKQHGSLPFFREKQQIVAIIDNQDAVLTCFAVGDPTPVVQWFKNDIIIGESNRVKIETDEEGRSILKFCPASEFDVGLYKVVARNKVGQTFIRTRVVLGMPPDSPDSPTASQISDTEVLLNWRQPKHDGYSAVLCYSLQYKLCDDVEWTQCADNIDHEFYLIKDLQPEKNYIFRLAARNNIGWGEFGVPTAIIKTKPAGAPKIQISRAMTHLQQLTDSGHPITVEEKIKLDYSVEKNPVEWDTVSNVSDLFNFISEISRGRFSVVVKGVNKQTDAVVAAKLIECKAETIDKLEQEWNAWRSLRHERIASLLAGFRKSDSPIAALIQERLQGADVITYLSSRHEYTEQIVATIISQVIDGLQYLHWRGLCHLNIQPDNVVLATIRSVQVKLVDFGSTQKVSKLGTTVSNVDCHSEYIAPEILNEEPAFPQSDIWSVGVLTYVLLSGTSPFRGADPDETRQNISFVRYRFEHLYKELTQEAVRFIMLIFKRHPTKRPTADECHEHRWFMPTDFMIKKRERAIFLGNRLKEYNNEYHTQKTEAAQITSLSSISGTKGPLGRSNSIQEELLTAQ